MTSFSDSINRRHFLAGAALGALSLDGCAGPGRPSDRQGNAHVVRLPRREQVSPSPTTEQIERERAEMRGYRIEDTFGRIESRVSARDIQGLRLVIEALGKEYDTSLKPEHYVVALKFLADRSRAEGDPRLSKVWLDAVGRERTGRFVYDTTIANSGGFGLLIDYARERPTMAESLAAQVSKGKEMFVVDSLLTGKRYAIEPRPVVAEAIRESARTSPYRFS